MAAAEGHKIRPDNPVSLSLSANLIASFVLQQMAQVAAAAAVVATVMQLCCCLWYFLLSGYVGSGSSSNGSVGLFICVSHAKKPYLRGQVCVLSLSFWHLRFVAPHVARH